MNGTEAMPKKSNMSHFGLNLGQTAEDSEMFTNIWLSSKGLSLLFALILDQFVLLSLCICYLYQMLLVI